MQWLIDIIKEWADARFLQPPCFIDRGDPAAYDWDQDDLIQDAAWHELDVSGIVPANASAIVFNAIIEDGLVNKQLLLRKSGNVNAFVTGNVIVTVVGTFTPGDIIVSASPNQKIEYNLSTLVDWCFLIVKGWWL